MRPKTLDVLRSLHVTPDGPVGPGRLVVDVGDLARSEWAVRYWVLDHDDEKPGNWAHWPSMQESLPLGALLLSLAQAYAADEEDQ